PQRINVGYPYLSRTPDVQKLHRLAGQAARAYTVAFFADLVCESTSVYYWIGCGTDAVAAIAAADRAVTAANEARTFLQFTPDALKGEIHYPDPAQGLLDATVALSFAAAAPGVCAHLLTSAYVSKSLARLIELAVRQLGFPSQLNLLGKGMSHIDPTAVGSPAGGISLETGT